MNVILLDPHEAAAEVCLTGARATHIRTVLGTPVGQTIRIGILDGPYGVGRVVASEADAVHLACTFEPAPPPRPSIDLLLALPRPKVLRRLWAQVAALGVGRIILTNAARVERNYFDTHVLAPDHYRPLLIEGLQQARDTRVPPVTIHRQFRRLVEDELDALAGPGIRLVADPHATRPLTSITRRDGERVLLAVGPEGGWNAFELARLEEHGFRPVGMGPRTLRTDTACIALLALLHAHDGAAG